LLHRPTAVIREQKSVKADARNSLVIQREIGVFVVGHDVVKAEGNVVTAYDTKVYGGVEM
jgi:hypothetical protein